MCYPKYISYTQKNISLVNRNKVRYNNQKDDDYICEMGKGDYTMRIEQLRYIADIAETGSLTATAQRQFVTQQAISKTVKQLEKELDATLLIRTRTGVSFTEIGKELVAFAEKVLAEEAEFQKHISQIKHISQKQTHNDMYIASTSSISNLLLPILIANPKMQENNVTIHINQSTTYEDVIEQVKNKKSDLGLITINETELPKLKSIYHDELTTEVIMRDKLVAVLDRRFYTGEVLILSDEDFAKYKIRTLYNIHPIELFQQAVTDSNVICSGDADFHRNMMEKAGAITLMSVTTHNLHFNSKRYVPLLLENYQNALLHVAIYRKSAGVYMENLLNLMRREMVLEGLKTK